MTDATAATFGDMLRYLRRRARLTQRELAIAVGYCQEHLSRLEHNRRTPDPSAVRALFVPALDLEDEPELSARLLALATLNRGGSEPVGTGRVAPVAATREPAHARLPEPASPLVGRRRELAEIARRLERRECRLLTLIGLGGAGKTRLALAAAAQQARAGVEAVFVPLAPTTSPDLLATAIATAMQLPLAGPAPLEQVCRFLRSKHLLLVLDNAEALGTDVDAVASLLAATDQLTILATSRTRLQLRSEWVLAVDGLATPTQSTFAAAAESDAVQLFVECARRGGHNPLPRDLPAVARICCAVGGLPFGIELAASWLRVLSCDHIAAELERDTAGLSSALHDVPQRHRSLRTVFEQAWGLLQPDEQRVLRRLAVHVGGFERAAAAAVAFAQPHILASLVDQALITRRPDGRYTMHDLVRHGAYAQLAASGELTETSERHAAYYRALAVDAGAGPVSEQRAGLDRLAGELENLRAALRWLLSVPGGEPAAQLCLALLGFWRQRGYVAEGRAWLETLVSRYGDLADGVRAHVLDGIGELAWLEGAYDRAQTALEQSLQLHRARHDTVRVAAVVHRLGAIAGSQARYAQAIGLYRQSLQLRRTLGDEQGVATTLNNLGINAVRLGALAQAHTWYEQSVKIFRRHGNTRSLAVVLGNQGELALKREQVHQARALYCESLRLRHTLGADPGVVNALEGIAAVAARGGTPQEAAILWSVATSVRQTCGIVMPPAEREQYDCNLAAAQAQIGHGAWASAWAHGQGMALEEAVAFALTTSEQRQAQVIRVHSRPSHG